MNNESMIDNLFQEVEEIVKADDWKELGKYLTKKYEPAQNVNPIEFSLKKSRLTNGDNFVESRFQIGSSYTSFSGADAVVSIVFKNGVPTVIGECQTLTYSIFRQMTPVYVLGSSKPKGVAKGPRTIAGSLIFTVFDRHVMKEALYSSYGSNNTRYLEQMNLADEFPPFDFHITWLNEYGQSSKLVIQDVSLPSEGQVMSIEDLITENTMQYIASDIVLMQPNIH